MANVSLILESSLKTLPHSSRWWFFWIILVISVITLIGNIFAIRSIIKRKQKLLQKVCIICLALADIFSVTMFAINNLDALSRELKIWKLGDFLCHFIPMGQVLGTTASSMALLIIAVDRYQNVTVAIVSKRWNPNIWKCLGVVSTCLAVCLVTSYPMYVFFTNNPIQVVYTNGPDPVFEDAYFCIAIQKDKLKLYYIIMAVGIFLPIIATFIWFYYQIAAMIWRHRKPFVFRYPQYKSDTSDSSSLTPKLVTKKTKTVQVQRKIRTFKVIIVLMVVFTICRLPYWIYFVIKLVETISGSTIWYFNFSLTALNMLNCALNPFLYAFLNQTIEGARKCHDFGCKILLRLKFQKNNSFVVNYETKKDCIGRERTRNNSKVKFIDVALPMYAGMVHLNKQLV